MGSGVLIAALAKFSDRLFGRGDAAVTAPPFDGALKPNQYLEQAEVFAQIPDAVDLAADGDDLLVAQGASVFRYRGGEAVEVASFQARLTALCAPPGGGLAVALEGRRVQRVGGNSWEGVGGVKFNAVNAIAPGPKGSLLVTDGSNVNEVDRWDLDLMTEGRTGRLVELPADGGEARELASGKAFAFGACATEVGEIWLCESWRHRVVRVDGARAGSAVLDALPCYPSRIARASGGGFWLTAFLARTQLVEFVLREKAYRERMIAEIDPRYWIAPKLSSGRTFLEPMQGAHIRTMGVLKPWAPPVSYGLVIRLGDKGEPLYSLHSRAGGVNHGVTAAVECAGALYVLAKGAGRILRLPIAEIEAELRR